MREVATLQLGSYANYVGAHFWNFQDELLGLAADMDADPVFQQSGLDMDVLYRSGETRQGVATYVPRVVALDLRGSLGAVRSSGSLYNTQAATAKVSTWSGRVETHLASPSQKSEFLQRLEAEEAGESSDTTDEVIIQKLDTGVQSWTDYLKAQLHHRSVYEVEGVWSGITPFEDFGSGRGLFSESFRLEEFQERFRYFVEECDHIQGVQALIDDTGGFSGVASDILTSFQDDYGNLSLMIFTVRPPEADSTRSVVRSLHDAVSFATLSSFADAIIPVGLPQLSQSDFAKHLRIDDSKPFHTSAVYATAIHGATLPFRMTSSSTQFGGCDMSSLLRNLSYATRKVGHLAASVPAPLLPGDLTAALASLSPDIAAQDSSCAWKAESLVFQGSRLAGLKRAASVSEVMASLNQKQQSSALSHVACSPCPLPVPLPFPSIFGSAVGRYGDLIPAAASDPGAGRGGLDVFSVPVATALRTDNAVALYLTRRLNDLEQLGLKRGARGSFVLVDWGFAKEEVEELREALSEVVAGYSSVPNQSDSE